MMGLAARVKPWIASLEPYEPGKPVEELERELGIHGSVKLASNENPLGPSPAALAALRGALGSVNRYPDGASFELRRKLAGRLGVAPQQLVFGCGSDELLELVAKAFLGPGDEAVYAWPSFAMYPIVVRGSGATPVQVPLDGALAHDLDAMAKEVGERTRVVVVCNPNNPTGTSVGAEAFDRFAGRLPADVVLVVDEAYVEYARRPDFPDALAWVARRPGTLVLRTFSKVYGLAGLRVGYALAAAGVADLMNRVRQPFNVNSVALAAATAALEDSAFVRESFELNRSGMRQLTDGFGRLAIVYIPSHGNFVSFRVNDAAGVYRKLLKAGVIVRPIASYGMPQHLRVTVGLESENARFLDSLKRAIESKV